MQPLKFSWLCTVAFSLWFITYITFFQVILQWLLTLHEMCKTFLHRSPSSVLVFMGFVIRVTGLWECFSGSHNKTRCLPTLQIAVFWDPVTMKITTFVDMRDLSDFHSEWLCRPEQISLVSSMHICTYSAVKSITCTVVLCLLAAIEVHGCYDSSTWLISYIVWSFPTFFIHCFKIMKFCSVKVYFVAL